MQNRQNEKCYINTQNEKSPNLPDANKSRLKVYSYNDIVTLEETYFGC